MFDKIAEHTYTTKKKKVVTVPEKLVWNDKGIKQLRHRVLQPTESLHAEVGGVVKCSNKLTYAFKDNGSRILAVAHCDTVNLGMTHCLFHENRFGWSTRFDDRVGVHIVLDCLPWLGIKTDILLTDGEESGRSTAKFFKSAKQYRWMVEFDRRGDDVVTYCFDKSMDGPLTPYFGRPGWGTYSDIRELEGLGCGGFNVGCGYHGEHSINCYLDLAETAKNLTRFRAFWRDNKNTHFKHEKKSYSYTPSAGTGTTFRKWDPIQSRMVNAPLSPAARPVARNLLEQWEQDNPPITRGPQVPLQSLDDGQLRKAQKALEIPGTDREAFTEADTTLDEDKDRMIAEGGDFAERLEDGAAIMDGAGDNVETEEERKYREYYQDYGGEC